MAWVMQLRGGMSELMRQAARMQRKIDQIKTELKERETTGSSADDKVRATATCEGKLTRVEVDPEFWKSESPEMICDAIAAAANVALKAADELVEAEIAKVTGGLKLPGMG